MRINKLKKQKNKKTKSLISKSLVLPIIILGGFFLLSPFGRPALQMRDMRIILHPNYVQAEGMVISEDTVWDNGEVIVVDSSDGLGIMPGVTLTIGPGTVIKLGVDTPIIVAGNLIIQGEAQNPAIITSLKDDSVGGDSNNDGNASAPAPGDWYGIIASNPDAKIIIDYAEIKYGGKLEIMEYFGTVIWGRSGQEITITHSNIINNTGYIAIENIASIQINYSNIYNPDFCLEEDPLGTGTPITFCGGPMVMNAGAEPIDMTNVYWGHADGPTDFSNISGPEDIKGTMFQGLINYEPFLAEPWQPEEPSTEPEPVILVPGVMGSWNVSGTWELDPILNTYDNLWEALKLAGYTEGETLFAFPYQWRLSNVYTAGLLKEKIQEVKEICNCDKVDIIAHSMGGLVARSYAQGDDYQNDIDQLIFLATPHLGAPESYLSYESAYLMGKLRRIKEFIFQVEAGKQGFFSLAEYIREKVLSTGQLLPVYNYLQDKINDSWQYRLYPVQYPINKFLEDLNTDSEIEKLKQRVNIVNIISSDGVSSTLESIRVIPDTNIYDKEWMDGYPYDIENNDFSSLINGNGDGTVPYNSLNYLEGVQTIELTNSDHNKIVTLAQKDVVEALTNIRPEIEIKNNFFKKLLLVRIFSPADFVVIAPDGKRLGKDFINNVIVNEIEDGFYTGFDTDIEFAVIPDPLDGEYKIELQGTGDGAFTISASLIDDGQGFDKNWTGLIEINENQEFSLVYDNEAEEPIADLEPEFEVSIDSLINDIEKMFADGLITKKASETILILKLKYLAIRLKFFDKQVEIIEKQIVKIENNNKLKLKVKEKRLENLNKRLDNLAERKQDAINCILDDFVKRLDIIKNKDRINRQGYDILINSVNYLRINL